MFDSQAAALFSYLLQKRGIDKVRDLANAGRKGEDLRAILMTPEWLGGDLDKAESEWFAWIRAQKTESQGPIRMISGGRGQPPPQ